MMNEGKLKMNIWKAGDLGLVWTAMAFLYNAPGGNAFPQTDDVLSGWAVAVTGDDEKGWVSIRTHYGYTGWVRADQLRRTDREELTARTETIRRVAGSWIDIYAEPKVQGKLLTTLPRGSFVNVTGDDQEGWSPVRDANGDEGWAHTRALAARQDGDGYLLTGCDPAWFRQNAVDQISRENETGIRQNAADQICSGSETGIQQDVEEKKPGKSETDIRQAIAETALSYLGAPYRWGGKTPGGIDCSGLAFMSYMENGILIYRDAQIRPEYPIREIPREQLGTGDLIFFPGHVAVCIGEGRYVHATAWKHTPWVTVNSLNPGDPEYREDLAAKVEACGSIF